ncbi:MAG: hypothetical protein AAF479_00255 [Pseudomonadota bacterium]
MTDAVDISLKVTAITMLGLHLAGGFGGAVKFGDFARPMNTIFSGVKVRRQELGGRLPWRYSAVMRWATQLVWICLLLSVVVNLLLAVAWAARLALSYEWPSAPVLIVASVSSIVMTSLVAIAAKSTMLQSMTLWLLRSFRDAEFAAGVITAQWHLDEIRSG